MKLTVSATFGLESVVRRECEAMGFHNIAVEEGHLSFTGTLDDIARCNLCLRSAERVFVEFASFPVTEFSDFFDRVVALPWERWIDVSASFPVAASSYRSKLASPADLQRLAKKAIAKRLAACGRAENGSEHIPEGGPPVPVEVRLRRDRCAILLDTTGEGLFKRGYRAERGTAPLKETLASGLVQLSYWNPERMLVDPFCGSGTILIEAALAARHMAPGTERDFTSRHWSCVGEERFLKQRRVCRSGVDMTRKLSIMGFDIDPEMIRIARKNAEKAGVAEDITFIKKDCRDVGLEENFGVLITNPPYGKRLGERKEVEMLMQDFFYGPGQLRTWSMYFLSALDLEALSGRKADRRRKFFNGGSEVTYYQFYGPNPGAYVEKR